MNELLIRAKMHGPQNNYAVGNIHVCFPLNKILENANASPVTKNRSAVPNGESEREV